MGLRASLGTNPAAGESEKTHTMWVEGGALAGILVVMIVTNETV